MRSASRATATSPPSCGTPRASCRGNGVGASQSIAAPEAELPVNRWIIGEVVETLAKLDKAFADLRFDDMADAIYHFTWGTFCDWYVELIKGAFDDETNAVAAWAFDQILVMLHPFMPFVTEELWHAMGERPYELIVAKWPAPEAKRDAEASAEIGWLVEFIGEARAMRAELNIPWSATLDPHVIGGDPGDRPAGGHAPTLVAHGEAWPGVGERKRSRRLGADRRRRGDLSPSRWPEQSTSTPRKRA